MKSLCAGLLLLASLAASAPAADQEAINELFLKWSAEPPPAEKVTRAYVRSKIRYMKMEEARTDARRAGLIRASNERIAAPPPRSDEDRAIDLHDVRAAIEALPKESQRLALQAHAVGFSSPEIAALLRDAGHPMSAAAVRQALARDIPKAVASRSLDRGEIPPESG
jgi:DNA-directed RNA polymerase specialized sigma24 family protein